VERKEADMIQIMFEKCFITRFCEIAKNTGDKIDLAFQLQNNRDERAGIAFYEIPPTPKPFTGKFLPASRYSPLPGISGTRDLDVRSSSKADEHYIAFPPSGLPVYGNVEVIKSNITRALCYSYLFEIA